MKKIVYILALLITVACKSQVSQIIEVKANKPIVTERHDYSTGKGVLRTYIGNDSIPFTGKLIHLDSRGVKEKEETFVGGVKEGRHIIRYHETGEPLRVIDYINGKFVKMTVLKKDGSVWE